MRENVANGNLNATIDVDATGFDRIMQIVKTIANAAKDAVSGYESELSDEQSVFLKSKAATINGVDVTVRDMLWARIIRQNQELLSAGEGALVNAEETEKHYQQLREIIGQIKFAISLRTGKIAIHDDDPVSVIDDMLGSNPANAADDTPDRKASDRLESCPLDKALGYIYRGSGDVIVLTIRDAIRGMLVWQHRTQERKGELNVTVSAIKSLCDKLVRFLIHRKLAFEYAKDKLESGASK